MWHHNLLLHLFVFVYIHIVDCHTISLNVSVVVVVLGFINYCLVQHKSVGQFH